MTIKLNTHYFSNRIFGLVTALLLKRNVKTIFFGKYLLATAFILLTSCGAKSDRTKIVKDAISTQSISVNNEAPVNTSRADKVDNMAEKIAKLSSQNTARKTTMSKDCPSYFNHEFRKLHSDETINLCSLYKGRPILIVNTASHCGFTSQFKDLEAFYQKNKADGVEVIGFASDSFNQEDKSEEKAADICYKNYGVSFTMIAPTPVKGQNANPLFRALAEKTQEPQWNFNKYLLVPENDEIKVTHFPSTTNPKSISL